MVGSKEESVEIVEQAFCVETINPAAGWRAEHGLWRASGLRLTSDASVAAQQIVLQARSEADGVRAVAKVEAAHCVQHAEQDSWQRAAQLIESLQQEHTRFLQRAESLVLDLAQALFERLICESSPRERLAASLRRIQQEAPPRLVQAVLRVHPADLDLIPVLEWEVKADAALSPGNCRLEAECGQWCASFEAAVLSLQAACAQRQEAAVALSQTMDIEQRGKYERP